MSNVFARRRDLEILHVGFQRFDLDAWQSEHGSGRCISICLPEDTIRADAIACLFFMFRCHLRFVRSWIALRSWRETRRFQKQHETADDNQNLKGCLGLAPGSVASFTSRALHLPCYPVRRASYS